MRVPEIMQERMCFSFEVFPPKIDQPIELLLETMDKLYAFSPDFISCTSFSKTGITPTSTGK